MQPWTRIESRPGPAGFVSVRTDRYRLANGTECEWDIIVGADSVAVLALTDQDQVILARQFRPGPDLILDELPGGGVEPGEPPAVAAARELLEETGYAGQVDLIGNTWVAGNMTRRRWLAVATGCRRVSAQRPDEAEQIQVVLRDLDQFRQQLRDGSLTDTAAGYRGLEHLNLL